MTFKLDPERVFKCLLATILVLTALNLVGVYIRSFTEWEEVKEHLVRLVYFDAEQNIPSFFSSLILLVSALLLMYITYVNKQQGQHYRHWLGLAVLFVFLSVDEAVSLHEILIGPVRMLLTFEGFFYFAWVVPYGVFTLLLFFFYFKFLMQLPRRVRFLMVLSGIFFVSGAVLLEMVGGNYYSSNGYKMDYTFSLIATVEEFMEMLGVSFFIYSLLVHIQTALHGYPVKMKVKQKEQYYQTR